jgi:hypothetical protein
MPDFAARPMLLDLIRVPKGVSGGKAQPADWQAGTGQTI